MATLIAVYNRHEKLIGKCDARCYNGRPGRCSCICGGRNHGIGLRLAAQRTIDNAVWYHPGTSRPITPGPYKIYRHKKLTLWAAPALFDDAPEIDEADELRQQLHGA